MDGFATQMAPLPYSEHSHERLGDQPILNFKTKKSESQKEPNALLIQSLNADVLSNRKEFFELMRRVDLAHHQWGKERQSSKSNYNFKRFKPLWLELGQSPALDFASTEVKSVGWVFKTHVALGAPRLSVESRHFGLFAPYGPMPIHITEHAIHEKAFTAFLNFLTAQATWLHYVARVTLHPLLGQERGNDSFGIALMRIVGIDQDSQRSEKSVRDCRFRYPGIYGSSARNFKQLQSVLEGYFHVPIQINKNIGRWVDTSKYQHLSKSTLGSWRLGSRFWDVQGAIHIVIGPIESKEFGFWKRRSKRLLALLAVVQDFVGAKIEPIVSVRLVANSDMKMVLGSTRIGQDSWFCSKEVYVNMKVCDLTQVNS